MPIVPYIGQINHKSAEPGSKPEARQNIEIGAITTPSIPIYGILKVHAKFHASICS